jgi:P-type E1-E2 ATPase
LVNRAVLLPNIRYYTYAVGIFLSSLASISWEIYNAKTTEQKLVKLTKVVLTIPVLRDGKVVFIDSVGLVPGDAVILNALDLAGKQCPCDMVLIQGECVMDESSLTGETVPVVKLALPQGVEIDKGKSSIICGGSKFVQVSDRMGDLNRFSSYTYEGQSPPKHQQLVIGIVTATGFSSTKGELFRSILYPKDIVFGFNADF